MRRRRNDIPGPGRRSSRRALFALVGALVVGLAGCASPERVHDPAHVADDSHSGGRALAVSPDSRIGASGGWSGQLRLWRLATGDPLARWQTGHGDLVGLMFLPDGRHILSTGHDGFVRIWRLDGRLVNAFETGSRVSSFAPAQDRRQVILGHWDGRVTLWSIEGERIASWDLSDRRISAVAVDAATARYAAGDRAARVWRWAGDAPPVPLADAPTYARSLQFNPVDEALFGSGWFDLFRWPDGGTHVETISTPHFGIVNHLEFSADGRYVASISRETDSAVLLLDPSSGETLVAFRKHDLCGQRVALSPDGRRMMSNSDDASVRIYDLPAGRAGQTGADDRSL